MNQFSFYLFFLIQTQIDTRNAILSNPYPYQIQTQNSLNYLPVIQNNRPAWQTIPLIHNDHPNQVFFNQNLPAQESYPCQMPNPFNQYNQHHQLYPRQQMCFQPANMYKMPPTQNNSQFTQHYINIHNSTMTQTHSIPYNTSYPPFRFANPTPQPIYNYVPRHSSFQQFQPNQSFMHPGSQFISNSASNMIQTPLLNNSFTTPLHLNNPQIRPIPHHLPPFNQVCFNAAHFNQTNILSRSVNESSPLNENQSCIDKENFFQNQTLTEPNFNTTNLLKQPRLIDPEIILNCHQITQKTQNIGFVQPYCNNDSIPLHTQTFSIPDKPFAHADSLVMKSNECESFLKKDENNSNKEPIDQNEPNSVESEEENTQEEESLLDKNESSSTEEITDLIESLISSVIKIVELNLIKKQKINQISVIKLPLSKNKMISNESFFSPIFEIDIEEEPNQEETNKSTSYVEPQFTEENDNESEEHSSKDLMDTNEKSTAKNSEKSCEVSKIISIEKNIEIIEKNQCVTDFTLDSEPQSAAKENLSKELLKMDTNEQHITEANEKSYEISKTISIEKNIKTVEKNTCLTVPGLEPQSETKEVTSREENQGQSEMNSLERVASCSESEQPTQEIKTKCISSNFKKLNSLEESIKNESEINKTSSIKRKIKVKGSLNSNSKRIKSTELRSSCTLQLKAEHPNDPIKNLLIENDDVFCTDSSFEESIKNESEINKTLSIKRKLRVKSSLNSNSKPMKSTELWSSSTLHLKAEHPNDPIKNLLIENDDVFCTDSSFEESIKNESEINKTLSIKRKLRVKSSLDSNSKPMKSTELWSPSTLQLRAKHTNDPKNLLIKNDDVFCTDEDFDEDYYLKLFKMKKCFVNLPSFNEN